MTIESVLVLLYLQQHQAGRELFGSVNAQDLQVTFEVCFGVLDEDAARLKAEAKAARSKETRTKTALRKAIEQRQEYGPPLRSTSTCSKRHTPSPPTGGWPSVCSSPARSTTTAGC
ncbi:hypothetical protein [Streptomyces alfalfae]|uniref:Uncharacterized protein n=1 Tax=Streptomyces alfalfae TaxID=1642299 RepID=A0A7T4PM76_9ACTN|nr:hypothetical protein [Streptomyces alfalfae]QQC92679.1 hypothetical protein I8755_33150 [Streptomyces alfalfae]